VEKLDAYAREMRQCRAPLCRLISSQQKIIMDSTTTKQSRQQPAIERLALGRAWATTAGSFAPCSFLRPRSTTLIARSSGCSSRLFRARSAGTRSTTATSSFAFQLCYAVGLLVAGRLLDRLGTRKRFLASVFFWSIAAMAHALAHSIMGFGAARVALAWASPVTFRRASRRSRNGFQKRARPGDGNLQFRHQHWRLDYAAHCSWITRKYGWRGAFIATGAIGFLWLIVWLVMYRSPEDHPKVSRAELAHIRSDPPEPVTKIPWLQLLRTARPGRLPS